MAHLKSMNSKHCLKLCLLGLVILLYSCADGQPMGTTTEDDPCAEYFHFNGMPYCPLDEPFLGYQIAFLEIADGNTASGGNLFKIDSIFCGSDAMECDQVAFEYEDVQLILDKQDTLMLISQHIQILNNPSDESTLDEFLIILNTEYPEDFPGIESVVLGNGLSVLLGGVRVHYATTINEEIEISILGSYVSTNVVRLKFSKL